MALKLQRDRVAAELAETRHELVRFRSEIATSPGADAGIMGYCTAQTQKLSSDECHDGNGPAMSAAQ